VSAQPFPWPLLPRLSRSEVALVRTLLAQLPGLSTWRLGGESATLRLGAPRAIEAGQLAAVLGEDTVVIVQAQVSERMLAIALPTELAVRLCLRALGAPEEEALAPRALTPAERGVLAYLALSALTQQGWEARVEMVAPAAQAAPRLEGGRTLVVPAAVRSGALTGELRVCMPEAQLVRAQPARAPSAHELDLLARLPVELFVELAATTLARGELFALERGDVVIAGPRRARLRSGRGGFPLFETPSGLAVAADYEPGESMSKDMVLEDLPVELTVELGRVKLSARDVLELRPGAVLELDRPLGGPVELYAGGRLVARGELVDVEGQLGVRVTELPGPE